MPRTAMTHPVDDIGHARAMSHAPEVAEETMAMTDAMTVMTAAMSVMTATMTVMTAAMIDGMIDVMTVMIGEIEPGTVRNGITMQINHAPLARLIVIVRTDATEDSFDQDFVAAQEFADSARKT